MKKVLILLDFISVTFLFLLESRTLKVPLCCNGPELRLFLTDSAVCMKSCVEPLQVVRSDEEALRFDWERLEVDFSLMLLSIPPASRLIAFDFDFKISSFLFFLRFFSIFIFSPLLFRINKS